MWGLDNETPFAVERNWTRDKRGVHVWLVAVRATFDIGSEGELRLADEQVPPQLEPVYRGDPAQTSLRLDSDLLAEKPTTDVVLNACAHAPKGTAAAMVTVSLRVGEIDKTLRVYGPRTYYQGAMGISISSPRPFVIQPIQYEFAFGGTDTTPTDTRRHRIDPRNPVGRGLALDADDLDGKPAHSIEYPSGNPDKVGPAGFAPIDRSWSPRLELAGTYDARWFKDKKPLLPDDYDERFALSAPVDQRPSKPFRGGETVTIENMTPEGTVRFELPKLFFAFTTRFGRREAEHRGHLATVFIETEEMRLSMIWQTTLQVMARHVEHLDATTITEKRYLG